MSEQEPTFRIRISRLVDGKDVRTYLEVQAANEVEALLNVVETMRKATHERRGAGGR